MPVKSAMLKIAEHIQDTIEHLDDREVDAMINAINSADRLFLIGTGRSGLVAKSFAMRLVQLGLTAYVVGETTSPSITEKDLLIAVSGSGETNSVVSAAQIAKKMGVKILTVTSYPDSSLGKISDYIVTIKGRTKIDVERDHMKSQLEGRMTPLTPLGTLFEDTVMIFFDGIIARLMTHLGREEAYMKKQHAKLEWFY